MIKNMRAGLPAIFKGGTKHLTGLEAAVLRNIEACQQLSQITRTSFGPNGLNKMVINHLDKLFVTSDAATIVREMEVEHPAAKLIVMAAQMQEQEVGDGSNLVIVFAGELLSKAAELIHMGLHPTDIVTGYEMALKKAIPMMDELGMFNVGEKKGLDANTLIKAIYSSISAKQYGNEDFLSKLVAEACMAAMPKNPQNFAVDNVRVAKLLGGSLYHSEVVRGLVVQHDTHGTIKEVKKANVAVYTCSIDVAQTETKGTVLIHNAEELMQYNDSEEKFLHQTIKAIKESGVNVIVTTGTVGEMAKHFLEKFGIMVVRISSQFDMRRLCRLTNANPLVKMEPPLREELGFCSHVYVREFGLTKVTVFAQDEKDESQVATVLLRGSTNNMLNDLERAVDDGVNMVRATMRDGRFVAGAGASEIELARRLASYASTLAGLEQYSCKAFAEALEVVPRTLAENAGLTAMDVISQLYAVHESGQQNVGVDIEEGGMKDMTANNIIDHLQTKMQALRLATNAVATVLRVDQIIMAKKAGGPKVGQGRSGHWDDD